MLGDAIRELKLDRRLSRRRGWLADGELDEALAALPDVSEKATTAEESDPQAAPAESAPGA